MTDQHYTVTITFRSGAQRTHGFDERARRKLLDAWRDALLGRLNDDVLLIIPLKNSEGQREDLILDPASVESVMIYLSDDTSAGSSALRTAEPTIAAALEKVARAISGRAVT